MFPIEITGNNRQINTKAGLVLTAQEAYAHIPGRAYPERIELLAPKGGSPYPKGRYSFGPESFYVGQFNKLELGLKLVAVK